jgi:aryl-alcohol dehydrogenase-like predicted oxidoreductase
MDISRLNKVDVEHDLDESLRALQCDYIDLYYLHRDDQSIPVSAIIDYMNDFVRMGKIRYFGVSNWEISRIQEAQMYTEQTSQQKISANQVMWSYPNYNLSASTIPNLVWLDKQARSYHTKTSLPVIAYQSQARGFLTKLAADENTLSAQLMLEYGSPENKRRFARAQNLAAELEVNVNAVSLAYVLNQPFQSVAIIGSHSVSQIQDSLVASDLILSLEQVRYLETGRTP